MKLQIELGDDLSDGGRMGRWRLKREELAVPLERGRMAVQILVQNDRRVEQRLGAIRLDPQRRVELLAGFLVMPTLHLDQSQSVPRLDRSRIDFERLAKTFLGGIELARAQLGGPQPGPAIGLIGTKAGVTGQFRQRRGKVVLFEVQATEVEVPGG